MIPHSAPAFTCLVNGQPVSASDSIALETLRPGLQELILLDFPQARPDDRVSQDALVDYRRKYVEAILEEERGEVSELEKVVIEAVSHEDMLSQTPGEREADHPPTFGERVADHVASFGGSWRFLITFGILMGSWILINGMRKDALDPFPFILLNLMLSCLAAVQAPVIMMSQNRKEARDRLAAEHDYQVNLKAELEIRHLHEKIDHLLGKQWERLAAIQQMQIELLENRLGEKSAARSGPVVPADPSGNEAKPG